MTMVVDDDNTGDWAADCNGEGWEQVVRDSGDSGVVMMATVMEDGGGGGWWQRRTTTAADDNGMQDWAVDYKGDGQKRAARDSGDSRVAMTDAAAEDGGGGQQWRRRTTTATADNDSGGWRRQWTTTARKIERHTTRGKEESRQQTTTVLDKRLISPPGREREKIKKSSLCKKTFFSDTVCPVWFFAPAKTANVPF
jgi:hypothetical protein